MQLTLPRDVTRWLGMRTTGSLSLALKSAETAGTETASISDASVVDLLLHGDAIAIALKGTASRAGIEVSGLPEPLGGTPSAPALRLHNWRLIESLMQKLSLPKISSDLLTLVVAGDFAVFSGVLADLVSSVARKFPPPSTAALRRKVSLEQSRAAAGTAATSDAPPSLRRGKQATQSHGRSNAEAVHARHVHVAVDPNALQSHGRSNAEAVHARHVHVAVDPNALQLEARGISTGPSQQHHPIAADAAYGPPLTDNNVPVGTTGVRAKAGHSHPLRDQKRSRSAAEAAAAASGAAKATTSGPTSSTSNQAPLNFEADPTARTTLFFNEERRVHSPPPSPTHNIAHCSPADADIDGRATSGGHEPLYRLDADIDEVNTADSVLDSARSVSERMPSQETQDNDHGHPRNDPLVRGDSILSDVLFAQPHRPVVRTSGSLSETTGTMRSLVGRAAHFSHFASNSAAPGLTSLPQAASSNLLDCERDVLNASQQCNSREVSMSMSQVESPDVSLLRDAQHKTAVTFDDSDRARSAAESNKIRSPKAIASSPLASPVTRVFRARPMSSPVVAGAKYKTAKQTGASVQSPLSPAQVCVATAGALRRRRLGSGPKAPARRSATAQASSPTAAAPADISENGPKPLTLDSSFGHHEEQQGAHLEDVSHPISSVASPQSGYKALLLGKRAASAGIAKVRRATRVQSATVVRNNTAELRASRLGASNTGRATSPPTPLVAKPGSPPSTYTSKNGAARTALRNAEASLLSARPASALRRLQRSISLGSPHTRGGIRALGAVVSPPADLFAAPIQCAVSPPTQQKKKTRATGKMFSPASPSMLRHSPKASAGSLDPADMARPLTGNLAPTSRRAGVPRDPVRSPVALSRPVQSPVALSRPKSGAQGDPAAKAVGSTRKTARSASSPTFRSPTARPSSAVGMTASSPTNEEEVPTAEVPSTELINTIRQLEASASPSRTALAASHIRSASANAKAPVTPTGSHHSPVASSSDATGALPAWAARKINDDADPGVASLSAAKRKGSPGKRHPLATLSPRENPAPMTSARFNAVTAAQVVPKDPPTAVLREATGVPSAVEKTSRRQSSTGGKDHGVPPGTAPARAHKPRSVSRGPPATAGPGGVTSPQSANWGSASAAPAIHLANAAAPTSRLASAAMQDIQSIQARIQAKKRQEQDQVESEAVRQLRQRKALKAAWEAKDMRSHSKSTPVPRCAGAVVKPAISFAQWPAASRAAAVMCAGLVDELINAAFQYIASGRAPPPPKPKLAGAPRVASVKPRRLAGDASAVAMGCFGSTEPSPSGHLRTVSASERSGPRYGSSRGPVTGTVSYRTTSEHRERIEEEKRIAEMSDEAARVDATQRLLERNARAKAKLEEMIAAKKAEDEAKLISEIQRKAIEETDVIKRNMREARKQQHRKAQLAEWKAKVAAEAEKAEKAKQEAEMKKQAQRRAEAAKWLEKKVAEAPTSYTELHKY